MPCGGDAWAANEKKVSVISTHMPMSGRGILIRVAYSNVFSFVFVYVIRMCVCSVRREGV